MNDPESLELVFLQLQDGAQILVLQLQVLGTRRDDEEIIEGPVEHGALYRAGSFHAERGTFTDCGPLLSCIA